MDKVAPGDVVSIDGAFSLAMFIPYLAIRADQRVVFKSALRPQATWQETHSTLYFDPQHLMSVEPPKATYFDAEQYIAKRLKEGCRVSILRRTPVSSDAARCHAYLMWMQDAAGEIVGTKYDYGQLIDIAINQLLGYGSAEKFHWFDLGSKRKVCSVATRTCFEHARHRAEVEWGELAAPTRLFVAPGGSPYWGLSEWVKYGKPSVECTTPAHFVNSQYFSSEFKLVITGHA